MMFKVNNQMHESFKGFNMKQSPYYINRNSKKELVTFRLDKKAIHDLKKHFKSSNDDYFSKGMRNLCFKELNNLCLEKKVFNNLECFMLIPKTEDVFELNNKSQVIAIVNTKTDFKENYNHKTPFKEEYNLTYELHDFKRDYFANDMKILQNTKESCVYNTNINDLRHFELFRDRQKRLYDGDNEIFDLNVDDCYFVRFPINNYLDRFFEGQFQYDEYKESHRGVYVLHDIVRDRKLFLLINWYYLSEQFKIQIDITFIKKEEIIEYIFQSEDDQLIEAFNFSLSDKHKKEYLTELKNDYERKIKAINDIIDKCED